MTLTPLIVKCLTLTLTALTFRAIFFVDAQITGVCAIESKLKIRGAKQLAMQQQV